MQDDHDWLGESVTPEYQDAYAEQEVVPQIDFDLSCARCGYNLRSTRANGTCPECGELVDTSLRPDLLHMANPAWLGKLRKGMNWLVAAILVNLAVIPIAFVVGFIEAMSAQPTTSTAMSIPMAIGVGIFSLVMAVLYGVAIWLITEPEHDAFNSQTLCSVTRWAVLAAMALSVLSSFFNASSQAAALAVGGVIDMVSSVLLTIGFLTSLWYLRRLANRIPEPGLAKQTMIVFWGNIAWIAAMFLVVIGMLIFALLMANSTSSNAAAGALGVMGLLMCPLLIAMLVFGIWWIVLMFRYRTRFTQAHEIALSQSRASGASSF